MAEHPIHKSKPWLKSGGKRKLTLQQRDEVSQRFFDGENTDKLAAEFGVNAENIRALAKYRGLHRGRVPRDFPIRKKLDQSVFSILTPESAYWVGILMSDGYIIHNRKVGLGMTDKEHIEKFRDFLKSTHKIGIKYQKKWSKKPHYSISVTSKRIVDDLGVYGVVPKKSLTAKVIGLENNRDFWRGVIDGDGSVYSTSRSATGRKINSGISIAGSKYLVEQFREFVQKHQPHCKANITKATHGQHYLFSVLGRTARYMIKLLYEDATVYLDRKYAKAMLIIKSTGDNGIFIEHDFHSPSGYIVSI